MSKITMLDPNFATGLMNHICSLFSVYNSGARLIQDNTPSHLRDAQLELLSSITSSLEAVLDTVENERVRVSATVPSASVISDLLSLPAVSVLASPAEQVALVAPVDQIPKTENNSTPNTNSVTTPLTKVSRVPIYKTPDNFYTVEAVIEMHPNRLHVQQLLYSVMCFATEPLYKDMVIEVCISYSENIYMLAFTSGWISLKYDPTEKESYRFKALYPSNRQYGLSIIYRGNSFRFLFDIECSTITNLSIHDDKSHIFKMTKYTHQK